MPEVMESPLVKDAVRPRKKRRPMLHIENGQVKFRTRLIRNRAAAIRFGRCLEGNSRFCAVEIVQSDRTVNPAWFVTFLPKNADRQGLLVERLQADRIARCMEEKDSYTWRRASGNVMLCTSKSGNVYQVSGTECSCTDFTCSTRHLGIFCKHILAYNMRAEQAETI